jgi:nucleotide-binding universal stress UspA family protein
MTILFAYDGSEEADAAISTAAELLGGRESQAVVLSVWEPLTVQALRAERFGSPTLAVPNDAAAEDEHTEHQARRLAEHGARVAGEAGFKARALWAADSHNIAETIVEGAEELDAELIVLGARGLTGVAALLGSVSTRVTQRAGRPVLVVPHTSGGAKHDAAVDAAPATV